MMEALSSSDTLVLTRATQRNIPEDGILHKQKWFTIPVITTAHVFLTDWPLRTEHADEFFESVICDVDCRPVIRPYKTLLATLHPPSVPPRCCTSPHAQNRPRLNRAAFI
jgi:hypothetical protein